MIRAESGCSVSRFSVLVGVPRRNRVCQADLFETGAEGTWRLCPVVDHATKVALACPITPTQGATARWFAVRAHLTHVLTRHRSPHTNGVVERWINTLKYEHIYRRDIASGVEPADRVAAFIDEYNTVRPHQALGQTPPLTAYLQDRTLQPNLPRNEQET